VDKRERALSAPFSFSSVTTGFALPTDDVNDASIAFYGIKSLPYYRAGWTLQPHLSIHTTEQIPTKQVGLISHHPPYCPHDIPLNLCDPIGCTTTTFGVERYWEASCMEAPHGSNGRGDGMPTLPLTLPSSYFDYWVPPPVMFFHINGFSAQERKRLKITA
jgi:hypothetical protein